MSWVTADEARLAWLAWRRGGIGASDASALARMDPYRGPMAVWLDKTGRIPLDSGRPEFVHWGNLLEPAIMDEFEVRTGLFLPRAERGAMLSHAEHPWMRATLDGLVTERLEATRFGDTDPKFVPGAVLGVLEVKTVAGFKSGAWADGVPDHFQLQVQHQLAVAGLDHAWIAVLFGGQRLEVLELERDDDVVASLVRLEGDFWHKHVLADVAPGGDGTDGTTEALRLAYAASVAGAAVELPAGVAELLAERVAAKEAVKGAEVRAAAADQALMALLGDAEVGLVDGRPRVTWKRQERTSVDLAALRARHPALAARYMVTSGFRVLRLVGGKEED